MDLSSLNVRAYSADSTPVALKVLCKGIICSVSGTDTALAVALLAVHSEYYRAAVPAVQRLLDACATVTLAEGHGSSAGEVPAATGGHMANDTRGSTSSEGDGPEANGVSVGAALAAAGYARVSRHLAALEHVRFPTSCPLFASG